MKICESWLREWVNPSITTQTLIHQLTMAGLEVDACSPVAGQFNGVVVAHVRQTKPHPQADKLTLCEVDLGADEPIQVVCGARNVRPGLKVALATVGAHLPHDIHIKSCKLRGELSQGMLCSTVELGMEVHSEGIFELPHDAPVGMDLREYLILDDNLLDLNLTPNRADCFSVLGVAREVAALNTQPCKSNPLIVVEPTITDEQDIILHDKVACPNYLGRVIRGIRSEIETPIWIQERLRRCGLRALHPVVDILNYVMLELGQPMHAYDLHALKGCVHVRVAEQDESLTLLDGQIARLGQPVLIIADDEKPLAIAGIMGGEQSSVKSNTVDVFLESAFFNPRMIAGVARKFGLNTDASQRFERGVDPTLQRIALERATSLIQEIVGGDAGPITSKTHDKGLPMNPVICFRPKQVARLAGLQVSEDIMSSLLMHLGMQVKKQHEHWDVTAPPYRFDVHNEADVVEEIIRLYGYEKIEAQPVQAEMRAGEVNQIHQLNTEIGLFFFNRGYQETISYSFVDPEIQAALYPKKPSINLLNPISSDLSQMRTGLWSGLIAAMIYNLHRQQSALRLFESGIIFQQIDGKVSEIPCIAGLVTGNFGQLNWAEHKGTYDFYDLKGDLQALFSKLKQRTIDFVPTVHPALHPGQSAQIMHAGQELGLIGSLHPALMDALDITEEVFLFELSLLPLLQTSKPSYKPISRYPQTRRDLSLIVDESVLATQIESAIREVVDSSCLKSFDIFDVYYGESIPEGKKSLAIALTLQSDNRTLVEAEIQSMIAIILQKLENTFSAVLRAV